MEKSNCKVCVTGGAGYIGSSLVKNLLRKGYYVHTTTRNLGDELKVRFLKSFDGGDKRLELFEADVYKPENFDKAIQGCEFVFHVANPTEHTEGYKYKNRVEATTMAANIIVKSCIRAGTVKRLVYTASVVAVSPFKEDGTGFKDSIDETCWTPLDLPFPYAYEFLKEYTELKTLAEKEILKGNEEDSNGLEVVTLACGLVGGSTFLSYTPLSLLVLLSPIVDNEIAYQSLKFLEDFLGKVPIVHIEDVCEAHIFCIEAPSIKGRFLCASSYVSTSEIATYYNINFPEYHVKQEYLDGAKIEIEWGSTKLNEMGFVYKYETNKILEDCITCVKKIGDLNFKMQYSSSRLWNVN